MLHMNPKLSVLGYLTSHAMMREGGLLLVPSHPDPHRPCLALPYPIKLTSIRSYRSTPYFPHDSDHSFHHLKPVILNPQKIHTNTTTTARQPPEPLPQLMDRTLR